MNEILARHLKEKIYGYVRGDFTVPEISKWASEREEFAKALPYIKDKSDIIFFLINQLGLETHSFYIEEKLTIKKDGIVKNLKRYQNGEITSDDLFNWADDIWNWELIEGYEDEIARAVIEHLAEDSERLNILKKEDYDDLIWHLEKSKDIESSIAKLYAIFGKCDLKPKRS